jgi:hypothetical protein
MIDPKKIRRFDTTPLRRRRRRAWLNRNLPPILVLVVGGVLGIIVGQYVIQWMPL